MRIVTGFLSVLGGLTLFLAASLAVLVYSCSGEDITVEQSLAAPDGLYMATLYSSMGGGAAGYCFMIVSINPISSPFSAEADRRDARMKTQVYHGSCDVTPRLRWASASLLEITLPEPEWSAYLRGESESGAIAVNYVFTHNKALQPTLAAEGGKGS